MNMRRCLMRIRRKFNRESILEINFRNGDTSGYFWYGEGSQYGLIAALCFQNASGDVEAAGWGNIFFHDANIKRFNGGSSFGYRRFASGKLLLL